MEKNLEPNIRRLLTTDQIRRFHRPRPEDRVSTFYSGRDSEIAKTIDTIIAGDEVANLGRELAARYGNPNNTHLHGETGTTKTPVVIADPSFEVGEGGDARLGRKFWIKYAKHGRTAELWKNISFAEFLDSGSCGLGWSPARDWPAEGVNLPPYYLVMLRGESSLLNLLPSKSECIEDAMAFMGDYFFGESDHNHWTKDKENNVIKAHIDLIVDCMRRTALIGDSQSWNKTLDDLALKTKEKIPDKDLWYCWVVSDCLPENMMYVNGAVRKEASHNFMWIDQGYRKDLLDAWLQKHGIAEPKQEDYFNAFYGTPHANLGHFWVGIEFPNNISDPCKTAVNNAIYKFISDGRFGRVETKGGERTKFKEWGGDETRTLANCLFNLGQLRAVTFLYSLGEQYPQHLEHFKEEGRKLIENTMLGRPYFFASPLRVKTFNA